MKEDLALNKNVSKNFRKYLLPSVFSMIVVSAYTFTDTFVVGRALGSPGLAAIGIATPVLTTLFALGFLYGTGGGAAYAVTKGQGDNEKASQIYTHSIFLSVLTGVVIMILGNLFINDIAYFLGATGENIDKSVEYMRWLFVFAPFIILDLTTNNFMRNEGRPNVAMTATMMGSGCNVVLDLLFVFVFKWGMFGASIATCMGSVIAVTINMGYSYKNKLGLNLCKIHHDAKRLKRILLNGVGPFILNFSVSVVTFFYINIAEKSYGELGVSTYAIIMNWNIICMNMLLGVAQSVQPLISLCYGKGEYDTVKRYNKLALITSIAMSILFLPFAYLIPEQLASVFVSNNPELIALSAMAIKLVAPTYLFMSLCIVIGYYFEAIEFSIQSLVIMLSRGFLFPVVMLYALSIGMGGVGIWISIPAAELISMIVALIIKQCTKSDVKIADFGEKVLAQKENTYVVTISREFGSGGREIGKKLAEKLQIPLYDKEFGKFTSAESGVAAEVIEQREEKQDDSFAFGLYRKNHYVPITSQIYFAQCKVIEQIASEGSAVIVGRCADSVLHGRCKSIDVFVHAPLEMRVKRMTKLSSCSEKQAVSMIVENDRARKSYHDFYTGTQWGNASNYDISINSALGIDVAVETIYDMIMKIK